MRGRAPDLRDLGRGLLFRTAPFASRAAASQTPCGSTAETSIGAGSTRAHLRAAHPGVEMAPNGLGTSFGAGDVYGLASSLVDIDNTDDWKRADLPYKAFKP